MCVSECAKANSRCRRRRCEMHGYYYIRTRQDILLISVSVRGIRVYLYPCIALSLPAWCLCVCMRVRLCEWVNNATRVKYKRTMMRMDVCLYIDVSEYTRKYAHTNAKILTLRVSQHSTHILSVSVLNGSCVVLCALHTSIPCSMHIYVYSMSEWANQRTKYKTRRDENKVKKVAIGSTNGRKGMEKEKK